MGGNQECGAAGVEHEAFERRPAGGHTMMRTSERTKPNRHVDTTDAKRARYRLFFVSSWLRGLTLVTLGVVALGAQTASPALDTELARIFRDNVYASRPLGASAWLNDGAS